MKANAPLAKLDIASVYGTEGQRFESPTARQERQRLNQTEKVLQYLFINGVAGVVAERQYKPKSYAHNYNVHGAGGKFVKKQ